MEEDNDNEAIDSLPNLTEDEEIMTTRYTQEEWRAMIAEAELDLPNAFPEYKAPVLGTRDFAKCIDHTLLKPEATKEQVDVLCEEAVRHDFKVCMAYDFSKSRAMAM